jgi:hypothetical protein
LNMAPIANLAVRRGRIARQTDVWCQLWPELFRLLERDCDLRSRIAPQRGKEFRNARSYRGLLNDGAGGGNRTHTGQSPTDFHTSYGFHRRPRSLWRTGVCGLDYPFTMPRRQGVGAARLVSTPSLLLSQQGLARDRHLTGFPEFEQFCIAGFPASTQSGLSPLRLPVPPRPQCQSGS